MPIWDNVRDAVRLIKFCIGGWIAHAGRHSETGHYICYFACSVNKNQQRVFKRFDDLNHATETFTLDKIHETEAVTAFAPYMVVYQRVKECLHKAVDLTDPQSETHAKSLNFATMKNCWNVKTKAFYHEAEDAKSPEPTTTDLILISDDDMKPMRPQLQAFNDDDDMKPMRPQFQAFVDDVQGKLTVAIATAFIEVDPCLLPVGMKSMAVCKETGIIAIVDEKHVHLFDAKQNHILSHLHCLGLSNKMVVIVKFYHEALFILHAGKDKIYKFRYNALQPKLELDAILCDDEGGYAIVDFVVCNWLIITIHEKKIMCFYMEIAAELAFLGYFVCKEMIAYGLDDAITSITKDNKHHVMIRQKGYEFGIQLELDESKSTKVAHPVGYTLLWTKTLPNHYIPTQMTSSAKFGSLVCTTGNKLIQSLMNESKHIVDIDEFVRYHFQANVKMILHNAWLEEAGINGTLALCIKLDTNVIVWITLVDAAT